MCAGTAQTPPLCHRDYAINAFYLRPKFWQLQRLLGPAYTWVFGNPTRERVSEGPSQH